MDNSHRLKCTTIFEEIVFGLFERNSKSTNCWEESNTFIYRQNWTNIFLVKKVESGYVNIWISYSFPCWNGKNHWMRYSKCDGYGCKARSSNDYSPSKYYNVLLVLHSIRFLKTGNLFLCLLNYRNDFFTNYTLPKEEFPQDPAVMDLLKDTSFDYFKEDQVK